MSDSVDSLSVSLTSAGTIQLTIYKTNGYDSVYTMEPDSGRFLFSELGTTLQRVNDD